MMRNYLLVLISICCLHFQAEAQKHLTRNGSISFFSSTPVEDISATNNQASCVIDYSTGDVVFQVLMKSFQFKKALMQEHFNENYVESDKYPKSTFKGKINNLSTIKLDQAGVYQVTAEGDLTIHGVSKKVKVPGTIEVKNKQSHLKSKFKVALKDYEIKVPSVVRQNISETIEVKVDMLCSPAVK